MKVLDTYLTRQQLERLMDCLEQRDEELSLRYGRFHGGKAHVVVTGPLGSTLPSSSMLQNLCCEK